MSDLPDIPELPPPDDLAALDDAGLEAVVAGLRSAERATVVAMAPYDRHLQEIRARIAEVGTELRRRERAAHIAQRTSVRQAAKAGDMPSLASALEQGASVDLASSLAALNWFLASGGQVGLGFATRPGTLSFTDGRRQQQARTWGEAVTLFEAGWEPGTPGIPGVRVHLIGSRVERVVPATEVVLEVGSAS